jgi:hypothetical protein
VNRTFNPRCLRLTSSHQKMRAASPQLEESSPASACNTLSLRSAARPIRVMGCLPQLLPPLCFTLGPFDPRDSPPTAEDACRQSLQPTYCQRAPNDSTMFPSRRLASPRTAPIPCVPPRRRNAVLVRKVPRRRRWSPKRTPTSSAVRLTAHGELQPVTNTLRGAAPRRGARGHWHCPP